LGRVHGRSRDIDRPAGVAFTSQINGNSVEPTIASRSRNLFSHDHRGPAGADEAKEVGPQMPWIVGTQPLPGDRKRLTRARAGPERPVGRPASKEAGIAPSSNTGEEMDVGVSGEVSGLNKLN